MQIIEKKVSQLIPYERNPRKNENAVPYVANSIKEFGFKVPIVIDKDDVIVAGHTRLLAAKQLGMETVPCIVADDLTEEQLKAFRLADNKTGEIAVWDFDMLDEELNDIFNVDMHDFGFDIAEAGVGTDPVEPVVTEPSYSYHEQYGVIVICKDEAEQEEVYNRLTGEGLSCKVVAV